MDYEGSKAPAEAADVVEGQYVPRDGASAPWAPPGGYGANPWPHGTHQQSNEYGTTDIPIEHAGRRRSGIFGSAAAGGALLLKLLTSFKFIIPALAKAPFLISLAINVVVYGVLYSTRYGPAYGFAYGGGIVGLILVHEMGHLVAARMTNTETTNPLFIPFMGAVIGVKSYRNATVEAINGIGGPILGTIGAIAVLAWAGTLGFDTQWGTLLVRLAYLGFLLNLFNMIPVTFGGGFTLDGGRVLQAISKWAFLVGPVVLGGVMVLGILESPLLILFLLLGAYGAYRQFGRQEDPRYHTTSLPGKFFIATAYFALLGVLVLGMAFTEAAYTAHF